MNVRPLDTRFTAPDNWQWPDVLRPSEKHFLRYGWVCPEGAKAVVIILPGSSEYIEKYFEIIRDLIARGFAVSMMEWFGHGMSYRGHDRQRRTADDFALDVADAQNWLNALSRIECLAGLPKIMLAHSMGGHIGLRLLHDAPDAFTAAVICAPMQGITALPFTAQLFPVIASAFDKNRYLPGSGPWSEKTFIKNLDAMTSDPARRTMQLHYLSANPHLRMGGLTFGWLRAALKSMSICNKRDYLAAIKTPTLLIQAGKDSLISNPAIARCAKHMPNARLLRIDGARHEILMERDVYRNQFWHAFDRHIAKHLENNV